MVEAEKSKSSKKRIAKAPWAKLLSQYPQVCLFAVTALYVACMLRITFSKLSLLVVLAVCDSGI